MFRKARLKDSEQPKMHIEYITLSLCNEIGDWQGRGGGGRVPNMLKIKDWKTFRHSVNHKNYEIHELKMKQENINSRTSDAMICKGNITTNEQKYGVIIVNISIHKMETACTEIKGFCTDSRRSKQLAETVFSYASVVIISSFTNKKKKEKLRLSLVYNRPQSWLTYNNTSICLSSKNLTKNEIIVIGFEKSKQRALGKWGVAIFAVVVLFLKEIDWQKKKKGISPLKLN